MTISRRQYMARGASLATTLAATYAAGPLAARSVKAKPIGIQLYTVRDMFTADPMGTLEKVAAIGYREVEFGGGGYEKLDHAALRKAMDRLGLKCPSLHIGYDALRSDFAGSVRMARTLGADTVVLPWMAPEMRTFSRWRDALANFNLWSRDLKAQGLGFAYHNHDFEFTQKSDGRSMFDMLVSDTNPDLVRIELDLFWVTAAGEQPKAVIRRLPGRVYAYHVKDRTADGKMTSVGAGTIDFADIFTLNHFAGVKHFYVENDQSPAPYLPDITASFAALSRLRA